MFSYAAAGRAGAEPTAALAFKIASDPFAGSLTYIRVYSGIVKAGETLLNPRTNKRERIQRLVRMHACISPAEPFPAALFDQPAGSGFGMMYSCIITGD